MNETPRRILLVDADAFYVAVARLVDPDGAGKAPLLIVGGSAERRGVVTSASYEARAFGVHSAMPMARALRLCPDALVVPVPWQACGEKSNAIYEVLKGFTPAIERASIDEFYVDLSGTERLYHNEPLGSMAHRIRRAVLGATGLPVSIGGGTTKLIAKIAAGVAKPRPGTTADGVQVVDSGREEDFMRRFSLAEIPLIGPKFAEQLAALGWRRVTDVIGWDLQTLRIRLGQRSGEWLYNRIRGIDTSPVHARALPHSISRDETFARDLTSDAELVTELLRLCDRAGADLREGGFVARTVTVKLRDWDFTTRQAGRTLPQPLASDRAIARIALRLLEKLRRARRVPARLVGVSVSELLPGGKAQLGLFSESIDSAIESERDLALARAVDELRRRFGLEAVRRGSL
ncbi:MAG TPA: DNA polymerase IV [Gemmatimonadales bacterium]|nr:DNA polymerase IV [Gemmatimonadales bacterium]